MEAEDRYNLLKLEVDGLKKQLQVKESLISSSQETFQKNIAVYQGELNDIDEKIEIKQNELSKAHKDKLVINKQYEDKNFEQKKIDEQNNVILKEISDEKAKLEQKIKDLETEISNLKKKKEEKQLTAKAPKKRIRLRYYYKSSVLAGAIASYAFLTFYAGRSA